MTDPVLGHHDAGQRCPCVVYHRPLPMELERHHVWPAGADGPTVPGNIAWLCPTTHTNVHELLRLYEHYGGQPPWWERRVFNRWTRHVAATGWQATTEKRVIPL